MRLQQKFRREIKRAAFSFDAFAPNPAMHQFHKMLGNRQAHAGAAERAAGRAIALRKQLENVPQFFFWNPDAGVADGKLPFDIFAGQREEFAFHDDFAGRREFDGIPDQVHQHLPQPPRIANQERREDRIKDVIQFQPFGVGARG